ncbi:MAG TPA: ion channel [Thermoanaerobaculia bacterium]|nr:ion channel [Thermoanaerobaculia bacterium]
MSADEVTVSLPSAVRAAVEDPNSDLGFGPVVARETRGRFLNRDGSFNVRRQGLGLWQSLSLYHWMLTISWPFFLGLVVGSYLSLNAVFAAVLIGCGPDALNGVTGGTLAHRFGQTFFFSVHTLATIGYGNVTPRTLAANIVVTIESLIGLLGFAFAAGIMFARFSRPTAQILFSEHAVITPYNDITAFMFRIANQKNNQIVELGAKVLLSRWKRGGEGTDREFKQLRLERDRVTFFPLSWTVVHPIDADSPLYGVTPEELRRTESEFLILLTGFDETFSQNVHTRSSYKGDEVLCGVRFRSMLLKADGGLVGVDLRELNSIEKVPTPT